jgi:hypothetical protein
MRRAGADHGSASQQPHETLWMDGIADREEVAHFHGALGVVAGSPGQRRAFAEDQPVIYRADFTDGSSAILTATVP